MIAPIGRGGMGEVFRAEDLRLGEGVALKFLPAEVAAEPRLIARLAEEVRLSRQVTHPNVCRVHDLVETDGATFLSMQLVEGEDLASLLARVRRLPIETALDLARQICEGMAAAHQQGVVHRDLKPANILVDRQGQARITDFGLAIALDPDESVHEIAGTPAYMAPEQLRDGIATPRSDIYAIGIVVYEMITGAHPLRQRPVHQPGEEHNATPTPLPSTVVQGVSPELDELLRRCLEPSPERRPQSVQDLLRVLPGSDPLAAALARGETPSPQMVAAASATGQLKPWIAWGLAATAVLALVATCELGALTRLSRLVPLPKSPEVLAQVARDLLFDLGYQEAPVDTARWMALYIGYLSWLDETDPARKLERLRSPRPPGAVFVYRESPGLLRTLDRGGIVKFFDPPQLAPGSAFVVLDPQGRLLGLDAVALADALPELGKSSELSWDPLFDAAEIQRSEMAPVAPVEYPHVPIDRIDAWQGELVAGDQTLEIRVHAAAFGGWPVFFRVDGPWVLEREESEPVPRPSWNFYELVELGVRILVLVIGVLLARRNIRRGRGDLCGATVVAVVVGVLTLVRRLVLANHSLLVWFEWRLWQAALGDALTLGLTLWVAYVAVEPAVRRLFPHCLVGWSRLLSGRWRDAMIARDVLLGVTAGLAYNAVSWAVKWWALPLTGTAPTDFVEWDLFQLASTAHFVSDLLVAATESLEWALFGILILMVLRLLLRRMIWVVPAWMVVGLLILGSWTGGIGGAPDVLLNGLTLAIFLTLLVRAGLLAACLYFFVMDLVELAPLTLDTSVWYAGQSWTAIAIIVALILFGLRAAPRVRLLERLFDEA